MILATTTFIMWYWIIVGIIALLAALIHVGIEEGGSFDLEDFFDDFFGEYAWVTFVIVLALGGIVFGFVAWIWWAMLLIILVPIVIIVIYLIIDNRDGFDGGDEEQPGTDSVESTSYKCDSCGAPVSKFVTYDNYGKKKIDYKCTYCNTCYTKNQLLGIFDSSNSISFIDLDDWEEEYFEVCDLMFFRPYNRHTMKQIDRKYERLQEKIDNCEEIYDNSFDDQEILDKAYDFFSDNEDEIDAYFKKYTEEEIKDRYDFYTKYNSLIDEDDDDEDE